MKRKQFLAILLMLVVIEAFILGEAIKTANTMLAVATIVLGMLFVMRLRKQVTEIVEDERVYKVSGKGAMLAVKVSVPLIAIAGIALITASRSGVLDLEREGYAFVFAICIIMLAYAVSYFYYDRKGD